MVEYLGCYPIMGELGGRGVGRGGKLELILRGINGSESLRGVGGMWVEAEGFALVSCVDVVFWIASMLRVTARIILLLYLVVDAIINPVDLASGKSSRCSETSIQVLGLNLLATR